MCGRNVLEAIGEFAGGDRGKALGNVFQSTLDIIGLAGSAAKIGNGTAGVVDMIDFAR